MFLWARQLHVILWKNIYLKRICRHYAATLIECGIMVILLLGIQEVSVAREPMVRRPDTVYRSIHPNQFWNMQPDMARIRTVYFAPDNRYVSKLTRDAFARLGVNHVVAVPTKQQLVLIAQKLANATPPVRAVALHFQSIKENDTKEWPVKLHVSLFAGRLPFDIQVQPPPRVRVQKWLQIVKSTNCTPERVVGCSKLEKRDLITSCGAAKNRTLL
ncbi:hypothetical protein HPB48_010896 [Haemaphysalis longicornis]|uniref:Uncharacterized protein n=1 Tax=Haemaphysalis longicornis TaxID=44386 RepID=A0A9J6G7F4_HAELO|nr:hypothetical protein HPB48_010896 [Haemaphysalis longicornis]